MTQDQIYDLLLALLPSLIVALVAYYFFSRTLQSETDRRRFEIRKETHKQLTPSRLQAYERMTLFLERLKLNNLVVRTKPLGNNAMDYERLLIKNIETEFDHNLAQQVYLSQECWDIIVAAKNTTIQKIREIAMHEKTDSVDKFREHILQETMDRANPSQVAIEFVKNEISEMF